MSRKPKRGYFVRGHFVAEGSELDLELKRQSKGDTDTSKSDLKRESEALQTLGKDLLTLRAGLLSPCSCRTACSKRSTPCGASPTSRGGDASSSSSASSCASSMRIR